MTPAGLTRTVVFGGTRRQPVLSMYAAARASFTDFLEDQRARVARTLQEIEVARNIRRNDSMQRPQVNSETIIERRG